MSLARISPLPKAPQHPDMSKPTIAIAGCTGALGSQITTTILSPEYRSKYNSIVLFSRKATEQTQKWTSQGATHITLGDSPSASDLKSALEGVNILVNAINTSGASLRDTLVKILPETEVKLYFPSEFGVDHMLHDFSMREWDGKKLHLKLAREICEPAGIKVCRVFIGLFLEDAFGEWYGYGKPEGENGKKSIVVEAVGDLDSVVSYTSLGDVGKVISILATEMERNNVPDSLRLAGSSASMREVSGVIREQNESKDISVDLRSKDGIKMKQDLLAQKSTDSLKYLRFLMGDGSIDYRRKEDGGLGNDNDLVNPQEKFFKWKTWQSQLNEF